MYDNYLFCNRGENELDALSPLGAVDVAFPGFQLPKGALPGAIGVGGEGILAFDGVSLFRGEIAQGGFEVHGLAKWITDPVPPWLDFED